MFCFPVLYFLPTLSCGRTCFLIGQAKGKIETITKQAEEVNDLKCGRFGGVVVSALDSGASGPGSSPSRRHCVVFLGKTLDSHNASLHPGV